MFHYSLAGLVFSSPFPCPELTPTALPPQVTIRISQVPKNLPEPRKEGVLYQAANDQFLFRIEEVATYLVLRGEEILIEPAPDASEEEIRLFLFNAVLAILLHQRGGVLPLHASGIGTDRGAVLFLGRSGAGKSTLLAEFLARGYRMMTDDLAPLQPVPRGRPNVLPTFPNMKLWADTMQRMGMPTDGHMRVRPTEEKYSIRREDSFFPSLLPLRAAYVLTPDSQSELLLEPLTGIQKFKSLLYRTAGLPFLEGLGLRTAHFKLLAELSPSIRLTRIRRPHGKNTAPEIADRVEADWQGMG
jgi:hypothetical protein